MKAFKIIGLVLISFLFTPLMAQETRLMIRVQAEDAKFIGTSIGGAKVIVREVESGEILAQGLTKGSTGDTKKIMEQPQQRRQHLSDEETAGFEAVLEIDEPVFVSVEALGPVAKKQASVLSSTQLWLIPGKDILGDGLILKIPGFVVDILSPQTHERIKENTEIEIKANVVLMCGCPVSEGGIWDASNYEITAIITSENGEKQELGLKPTEKESTFSQKLQLKKGLYNIKVYAYDAATGNTGLDQTNIIIN